jgi:hypothetical protein
MKNCVNISFTSKGMERAAVGVCGLPRSADASGVGIGAQRFLWSFLCRDKERTETFAMTRVDTRSLVLKTDDFESARSIVRSC